jgi:hypothetical protein
VTGDSWQHNTSPGPAVSHFIFTRLLCVYLIAFWTNFLFKKAEEFHHIFIFFLFLFYMKSQAKISAQNAAIPKVRLWCTSVLLCKRRYERIQNMLRCVAYAFIAIHYSLFLPPCRAEQPKVLTASCNKSSWCKNTDSFMCDIILEITSPL